MWGHYDYCGYGPHQVAGYGKGHRRGYNFAIIVVLFILLIIVGASYYGPYDDSEY